MIAPGWAGVDSTTFSEHSRFGTSALLGGTPYADGRVILQQDTALTTTAGRVTWTFGGFNEGDGLGWTLDGPIHGIEADISGGNAASAFVLRSDSSSVSRSGAVRFSGTNTFDADILYVGSGRNQDGLLGNHPVWDRAGMLAIFTSEAAFGNANQVILVSGANIGSQGSLILFEDATGSGTAFSRDILSRNFGGRNGFGSFAGEVTYSGTFTNANNRNILVQVVDGTMLLDGATITNNAGSGTQRLVKAGDGTLVIQNTTFDGTSTADYELRVTGGELILNQDMDFAAIDFDAGTSLGGTGTLTRTTTGHINVRSLSPGTSPGQLGFVASNGNLNITGGTSTFELFGTVAGSFYDQVVFDGNNLNLLSDPALDIALGFTPSVGDEFILFDLVNPTSLVSGTFFGLPEGESFALSGPFGFDSGLLSVTFSISYEGGDGNDIALMVTDVQEVVIPEPGSALLLGLGALALTALRRRRD